MNFSQDTPAAQSGGPAAREMSALREMLAELRGIRHMHESFLETVQELCAKIDSLRRAGAISIPVDEAARRLSCSPSRIYELLKRRALESAPSFGRGTMVLASSVERLAREGLPLETDQSRGKKREFKIDPKKIKV